MQLVDGGVAMLDPMKDAAYRSRSRGTVRRARRIGVDVQALAGDSTDNVPGVPGIGVKTAAQLINTYGDLDTLLERAEEIKQPKRRAEPDRQCRDGAHLPPAGEAWRTTRRPLTLVDEAPDFGRHGSAARLRWRRWSVDPHRRRWRAARRPTAAAWPTARAATAPGPAEDGLRAGAGRRRWRPGWRRAQGAASSPSTPRPPRWTRLAAELVGISLATWRRASACYVPRRHGTPLKVTGLGGAGAGGRADERPADRFRRRHRAPQTSAGGPVGPEDRPEHQI